jgi:hypothetical protein
MYFCVRLPWGWGELLVRSLTFAIILMHLENFLVIETSLILLKRLTAQSIAPSPSDRITIPYTPETSVQIPPKQPFSLRSVTDWAIA